MGRRYKLRRKDVSSVTNYFLNHILMAWVCDHVTFTPGKLYQPCYPTMLVAESA